MRSQRVGQRRIQRLVTPQGPIGEFYPTASASEVLLYHAAPRLLRACRAVLERGDSVPQWALDILQAATTEAVSG